jgi:hypothetical protein
MTTGAIGSPSPAALTAEPPAVGDSCQSSGTDRRIRAGVQQILHKYRYRRHSGDRRGDRREPFPYPVYVTPVGAGGVPLKNETIVVLGKHLSERGLDFYCEAPLPYRRVIASWECSAGDWMAMIMDLRWCRSNRHGWYENGGRFLQIVDSPMAQ